MTQNSIGDSSNSPTLWDCFSRRLERATTIEDISDAVVSQGSAAFDACVVVLALLSEDKSEFYCPRISGYPDDVCTAWNQFPASANMPIPVALREERMILLESLDQRRAFYPPELPLPAHVGRALAAIPFRSGKIAGCLGLTFLSDRSFGTSDRDHFQRMADICAQSLSQIRLQGLGYEVLLVEDQPDVMRVLNFVLQFHAFKVRRASSGEEAIHIYKQHWETVDVILLDVQMPKLDGPQTLLELRRINPELRCLFMSGNSGEYTGEQLLSMGAVRVLTKPFGSMRSLIKELLEVAKGNHS